MPTIPGAPVGRYPKNRQFTGFSGMLTRLGRVARLAAAAAERLSSQSHPLDLNTARLKSRAWAARTNCSAVRVYGVKSSPVRPEPAAGHVTSVLRGVRQLSRVS
nr:hypothetical protein CDS [Bradyrhizobium sp.]